MNKLITTFILSISLLFVSCTRLELIEKESLVGKKFTKTALIMGSEAIEFVDDKQVIYIVYDKKSFGYKGRYILETMDGKQYIRINHIEKFGALYMLESISNKEKLFEVRSSTELRVVHSGKIFTTVANEQ